MDSIALILHLLPFTYFVSVVATWFIIHLFGEKSGVPRFLKAEVIFLPVLLAALKGVFPAVLLSLFLLEALSLEGPIVNWAAEAGYVVSGFILHRKLHSEVSNKVAAECTVSAIALIYIIGWAVSFDKMIA
ncbi:hypothetical protein [Ruegeria meonggei]|uniref:hypothetical protein n=1 Tax=Ruegeria meonggei TaxID=1446476 RepID=UPI00366D1032